MIFQESRNSWARVCNRHESVMERIGTFIFDLPWDIIQDVAFMKTRSRLGSILLGLFKVFAVPTTAVVMMLFAVASMVAVLPICGLVYCIGWSSYER